VRQGFWTDCFYFLANAPVGAILGAALSLLTVGLFWDNQSDFEYWLEGSRLTWPVWVQVVVTLLIMDFIFYWQHWLFHHSRMFWKIHTIHHSSVEMDWLSTSRLHVLELLFFYVLVPYLLLLVGFLPIAFFYGNMFKQFYNFFLHANVSWTYGWFGHIIASPRFHRWHHETSKGTSNLATMFSFYDHLFGTWYLPEDKMPVSLGVPAARIPDNIVLQQIYPFYAPADTIAEPSLTPGAPSLAILRQPSEQSSSQSIARQMFVENCGAEH
jgi:sterol desaturase/sphingolipid hydroxylase (fatty acid hydroxylase superfamily)